MKKNEKVYNAIVFDVDSTLVNFEGLDWLASRKSLGKEMEKLTKLSMEGELDFNEAMVRKMKAIAPTIQDLEELGEAYCKNLSPGVESVIEVLHAMGKEVWILTGNFNPAVITIYEDRSFDFVIKKAPVADMIKKVLGIDKGSGESPRKMVGELTDAQIEGIAKDKMDDLNANDLVGAKKIVAGTARSMGVKTPEY